MTNSTPIRLNRPNIPFDQFILRPNFDIIYKREYGNANDINYSGVRKLQLALLYDKITKQYKMVIHSSDNSYESAYGLQIDEWLDKCELVETTDNIISLRDENINKIDRIFVKKFIREMNSILLIMRYKSISKSIRFLYDIFNSNKDDDKFWKYHVFYYSNTTKHLKFIEYAPIIMLHSDSKIIGFNHIRISLKAINDFYINNRPYKKFKRTFRNTWLRFRYKINNMFRSQPSS